MNKEELTKEIFFSNDSKVALYYDLLDIKKEHIILLNNILNFELVSTKGYKYLIFNGKYIYGNSLFIDRNFSFYFPLALFKKTWNIYIGNNKLDHSNIMNGFIHFIKPTKRKLIILHHKLIKEYEFDFEKDKALFLNEIIK